MKFVGFDWDHGNWPKCGKHGLTKEEIESVFHNEPRTSLDPFPGERIYRAIGSAENGRFVFIVFTIRELETGDMIRPISARYMHDQETQRYGK